MGSVSLGIGVKEKKEIKKEIKAAPSQFVSPTKSKFFWVIKVENKCQTCHIKKFTVIKWCVIIIEWRFSIF